MNKKGRKSDVMVPMVQFYVLFAFSFSKIFLNTEVPIYSIKVHVEDAIKVYLDI